jgi:deazaflavin-dependent oxidoreductase (nitroreductase family)
MSVVDDLGYEYRPPGAFRRVMQAVASTRPGAWFFSKTLEPMDRVCRKATKGRTTVTQVLAGLPVVYLTTTGRRSGELRTHPLAGVPIRDTLALIGSNFGGRRTPAWVLNLEANPKASVTNGNTTVDVTARSASEEENSEAWTAAAKVYPGYAKYRERVKGRDIRVFILESVVP